MRALLILLAVLGVATPAHASVTPDSDEPARWQAVIDQSAQHVPVPPWVRVKESTGPCPPSRGCYDGWTIWLTDPSERTFRHELGHAADFWRLSFSDRMFYEQTVPQAGPTWLPGAAGEWFAESYEDCSLDPSAQRVGEHAYGYVVTDDQYRAVCAHLGDLAHPAPPPPAPATPQQPVQHRHKVCRRRVVRRHHKRVRVKSCRWVVDSRKIVR